MYRPQSSSLATPSLATSEDNSRSVATFLSNLAFTHHGFRLGLMCSALVLLHSLLFATIPWEMLQIEASWQAFISWFVACTAIAVLDRLVISNAVFDYRRSFLLMLRGEFDHALQLLERISPYTTSKLIHCPPLLFNLQRAFISLQAGALIEAQYCLERAKDAGLDSSRHDALLMQIFAKQQDMEAVDALYQRTREEDKVSALIDLEYGLILAAQRNNWRESKKAFLDALAKPKEIHFSGLETTTLATAFLAVCHLWTGKAEEGLDELNLSILNISSSLFGNEGMRPITALLLLERSLYYVTHQEPESAIRDLRNGVSLCQFSQHKKLAAEVIEELSWRFPKHATEAFITSATA